VCSACGIPTHVLEPDQVAAPPAKFAALRNADCRPYLFGAALAMMADNIEHVITYWVLWQKFHSPALAGFEVISHWVPFLLFSVYFGSLADRYDCRRLIQAAQALFMLVSALWGVLFLTGSLRVYQACVLLVLHGTAGALWGPGEQLMLHDFVGREELPSAVRLNATFRSLGVLFGPVVGSVLLLGLGPTRGIFANILFYLPLTLFLFRTRFTGHVRDRGVTPPRIELLDSLRVLRDVRSNHVLVSMIVLGGLGSFFVGTSLQTAMPLFAHDLGAGSAGTAYGVLLFANGAGGVIGGVLLEVTGRIRPTVKAAVVSTAVYGVTTVFFALTSNYLVALVMLLLGGIANLASMSIGQTIVQLLAPPADRGRVIGLYGVSANGLRAGSGFTVGILGAAIGIHWSLGLSAVALCLGTLAAGIYALRGRAIALPAGLGQGARDRAQHEAGLTQGRQVVHPRHHGQLATGDPGRGLSVGLDKGRIVHVANQQRRRHRDLVQPVVDRRIRLLHVAGGDLGPGRRTQLLHDRGVRAAAGTDELKDAGQGVHVPGRERALVLGFQFVRFQILRALRAPRAPESPGYRGTAGPARTPGPAAPGPAPARSRHPGCIPRTQRGPGRSNRVPRSGRRAG
jgi:MFS family permease